MHCCCFFLKKKNQTNGNQERALDHAGWGKGVTQKGLLYTSLLGLGSDELTHVELSLADGEETQVCTCWKDERLLYGGIKRREKNIGKKKKKQGGGV